MEQAVTDLSVLKTIAAAIATLSMIGSSIGLSMITWKYFESIARQPEIHEKVKPFFFIGAALTEAIALFAFAIAAMCLFM